MEHFYLSIDNWLTSFTEVYRKQVQRVSSPAHFIEVGGSHGKSTAYMAVEIINSGKNIKFDVIDIWESDYSGTVEIFKKNLKDVLFLVNPIQMDSIEASKMYKDNSIDFIFLDGNHAEEYLFPEILTWLPKVKQGGVLAGHDFGEIDSPGVEKAVKMALNNNYFIHPEDTRTWVHNKK